MRVEDEKRSKCWNLKGDSWTYHNFEYSLCQLWVWDFVDLEGGQPIRIPKFQLQKANCAKNDWNFGGSNCKLMEVMPICKGIGITISGCVCIGGEFEARDEVSETLNSRYYVGRSDGGPTSDRTGHLFSFFFFFLFINKFYYLGYIFTTLLL